FFEHLMNRWTADPAIEQERNAILEHYPNVAFSEIENALFVIAVSWIANDFDDLKLPIRHFQFERMVEDEEYFLRLLRYLFGSEFARTPEYLEKVRALGRVNTQTLELERPWVVFERWEPWQRYCF